MVIWKKRSFFSLSSHINKLVKLVLSDWKGSKLQKSMFPLINKKITEEDELNSFRILIPPNSNKIRVKYLYSAPKWWFKKANASRSIVNPLSTNLSLNRNCFNWQLFFFNSKTTFLKTKIFMTHIIIFMTHLQDNFQEKYNTNEIF